MGFKGDKKLIQALVAKDAFNRMYSVTAGKFRRYYGIPIWRQALDIPTVLKNIGDVIRVIRGTFACVRIIRRERPKVIFAKGGFVSVPVGIAAKITNIPLVTHDSDTVPGLANRIGSRWAVAIATGAPAYFYRYPKEKIIEVGVPVDDAVLSAKKAKPAELRNELSLPADHSIITVVGGTHGGKEVNEVLLQILPQILKKALVVHVAGDSNIKAVQAYFEGRQRPEGYRLEEVLDHQKLMKYFRVSDLVISRVGASIMAELAILGRAAILVPNPKLTGGHQLKNAQRYAHAEAAVVLQQKKIVDRPEMLLETIGELLGDDGRRKQLADHLAGLAKPRATEQLAKLILDVGAGDWER